MTGYNSLHLANTGYCFEFKAEPSALYCADLDLRLAPEEFDVKEVYRFGGDAVEDNGQVLYLITSFVGVKGTLTLDVEDIFEENMSFEMAVKLRTHPYGEWICS